MRVTQSKKNGSLLTAWPWRWRHYRSFEKMETTCLPGNNVSYNKKLESSATPLWEPQISNYKDYF